MARRWSEPMPDLVDAARRAAHRLLAGRPAAPPAPGESGVATGLAAALAVEAAAGARIVRGAALARRGELAAALDGGLATALGLALGGERCAVVLTGDEVLAAAPLLRHAAASHAPLVVHQLGGTLEDAWSALRAGLPVWMPSRVTEVADLAVIARRHAESVLAPALVAQLAHLADAWQDCHLPDAASLAIHLGSPADEVHAREPGESRIFGAHRRRLPRWHDAERAWRLAPPAGPLATPARGAELGIFEPAALASVDAAAAAWARVTGRPLPAVSGRRLDHARLALVVAGADAEAAGAVAEALRGEKLRIGVVVVHRVAPFPAAELAERIAGCPNVAVLERLGAATGSGPLAEAVAAALAADGQHPKLGQLIVAGAGAPLGALPLADALRELASGRAPRLVLALPDVATEDPLPRRAAHADALRRDAPLLDALAAPAGAAPATAPVPGRVTLALDAGDPDVPRLGEVARLLHAAAGGYLRGREAGAPLAAGGDRFDQLTWSPDEFADPGADAPVDLLLLRRAPARTLPPLGVGCELLGGEALPPLPPPALERVVAARALHRASGAGEPASDFWLGALVAVAAARAGVELTPRKLRAARATLLPEEEREGPASEACLDAVAAGANAALAAAPAAAAPAALPPQPLHPPAMDDRSPVTRRHWDVVGLPVRAGLAETITPDPLFAFGLTPAHAAPRLASPVAVPRFAPAACSGCGDCWSACPHGAISARVLAPATILGRGFELAVERGVDAEGLRRFAGKLAGLWQAEVAAAPGAAAASWSSAAERLLGSAGLPDDRRAAALAAASELLAPFAAAPLAAPPPLREAGELLALALDPDACTACGLCIEVCADGALAAGAPEPAAAAASAAVEQLPATAETTRARLAADARVGPLAAALLDPAAAAALGGADGAPAGSGSRLAVRQTLALLVGPLGAARTPLVERVADLRGRLAGEIHGHLAGSLPDRDLDALARGLVDAPDATTDLPALAGRVAGALESGRIDVATLRRRVELARALADLEARLAGTAELSPRAPATLVIGPGAALAWATAPLENPFGLPVTVAPHAPLSLARGLLLAEIERARGEALVLRRARLELERPGEARAGLGERPAWSEMDEVERRLATPVVTLLDERAAAGEIDVALELVAGDRPALLLTLAPPPGGDRPLSPWAAIAAATPGGLVAHGTVAHGDALADAAAAAASRPGGALWRLLAPDAALDELAVPSILEVARGVVEARGFPVGCRPAVDPALATPRVDVLAATDALERRHAAELAEAEARHRAELARLEGEATLRLAGAARQRMLELLSRHRPGAGTESDA